MPNKKTPAKIDKAPKSQTARVGDTVAFKCEISGNPIPSGSWLKDKKQLKDEGRLLIETVEDFTELEIESVEKSDEGEYTCVVKNDFGEDKCSVTLTIEGGEAANKNDVGKAGEEAVESDDGGDGDSDVESKDLDLPLSDPVFLATDKKFDEKYTSMKELGKGKFGVVKKVKEKSTGTEYAAKFLKITKESREEVLAEMLIMNKLHSKRLIYLYDAYERPKEMIIVLELISGGELFEKVCSDDDLTEKEVVRYMKQILQGVEHMHKKRIVHLDLKPENVLCVIRPDGKEDLKLIDFGMARVLERGKTVKVACGTPEFVAPEVLSYEAISLSSDMWSVGVIAYVLLSGLSPFMGDDDNETIQNVSNAEWDFEDEAFDVVSDLSRKFIEELLLRGPEKRNDVFKCMNHDWLQKIKTIKTQKLSTDNLKKFIARRRWARTANALRALSRMGSLGGLMAGKGGAAAAGAGAAPKPGGFLKKVKEEKAKEEAQEEAKPEPKKEPPAKREEPKKTSGLAGAANTPQAIAKRYASGGLPLKLEGVDKFWGIKHELAKGRFSVIKRCLDAKTKKPFVAKIIKYEDDTDRDDTLQEFDIHRSIKGDKVVMLRDAFLVRTYLVLIMDLLEGQDILSFVAAKPRPNEEDICFVIRPLLDVVNYLHGQQIVHLDIRPANLFIAKSNLALKLIDFGSARRIKNWKEGDMLAIVSYAAFTAPELLDFAPVSGGADMWSIGVLLYAIMSGILPFAVECKDDEDEDEKITEAVKKGKWSFDSKAFSRSTSEVKDFITALMSFDAKKRPSAAEAMKNPWLQGDNMQKRRSSDIASNKLKDLAQQLVKKDKEDVVSASCVLKTFSEDPYDSPESDEE